MRGWGACVRCARAPSPRRRTATSCAAASASFDNYFSHVSATEQLPSRFEAIPDVRTAWSADACVRVVAVPAVSQQIAQRSQRAWTQALAALETAVGGRASAAATDCINRNPAQGRLMTTVVKNRRRQCLTLTATWNSIETQALSDWEQGPDGHPFVSRHADAASYLTSHRRALQNTAITAMEARH
jgi:hypothetical protein